MTAVQYTMCVHAMAKICKGCCGAATLGRQRVRCKRTLDCKSTNASVTATAQARICCRLLTLVPHARASL